MVDITFQGFPVHFLIGYMILLCLCVPILHICLIRITKLYGESALPLILSCTVCLLAWCLGLVYSWQANFFEFNRDLIPHILTSIFIYSGFVIGYFEFFSLINRGYSLSIMMDISRRTLPPTITELEQEYAGGLGLRWMLTKRVKGLASINFISVDDEKVVLNKGWPTSIARILEKAKIFFSIQGSG